MVREATTCHAFEDLLVVQGSLRLGGEASLTSGTLGMIPEGHSHFAAVGKMYFLDPLKPPLAIMLQHIRGNRTIPEPNAPVSRRCEGSDSPAP